MLLFESGQLVPFLSGQFPLFRTDLTKGFDWLATAERLLHLLPFIALQASTLTVRTQGYDWLEIILSAHRPSCKSRSLQRRVDSQIPTPAPAMSVHPRDRWADCGGHGGSRQRRLSHRIVCAAFSYDCAAIMYAAEPWPFEAHPPVCQTIPTAAPTVATA